MKTAPAGAAISVLAGGPWSAARLAPAELKKIR